MCILSSPSTVCLGMLGKPFEYFASFLRRCLLRWGCSVSAPANPDRFPVKVAILRPPPPALGTGGEYNSTNSKTQTPREKNPAPPACPWPPRRVRPPPTPHPQVGEQMPGPASALLALILPTSPPPPPSWRGRRPGSPPGPPGPPASLRCGPRPPAGGAAACPARGPSPRRLNTSGRTLRRAVRPRAPARGFFLL